jgi:hypothetical protein
MSLRLRRGTYVPMRIEVESYALRLDGKVMYNRKIVTRIGETPTSATMTRWRTWLPPDFRTRTDNEGWRMSEFRYSSLKNSEILKLLLSEGYKRVPLRRRSLTKA